MLLPANGHLILASATQTHALILIYSSGLNLIRKIPTNLMNSEVDGQLEVKPLR
jgi:hypothetical protein